LVGEWQCGCVDLCVFDDLYGVFVYVGECGCEVGVYFGVFGLEVCLL